MSLDAAPSLAERQRVLLAMIKSRELPRAPHDGYLAAVAASPGLQALIGIERFWKEYSVQSRCPFTAGLLRQRGLLRDEVTCLIREEKLPPFIEEMTRLFLVRAADHPDPLVATLARFEHALLLGAEGDPAEHRIEWSQDPYYVLGCLLDDRPIDTDRSVGRFVTVVSPAIPDRFRVEPAAGD